MNQIAAFDGKKPYSFKSYTNFLFEYMRTNVIDYENNKITAACSLTTVTNEWKRPFGSLEHFVIIGNTHGSGDEYLDQLVTIPYNVTVVKFGMYAEDTEYTRTPECEQLGDMTKLVNKLEEYRGADILVPGSVYPEIFLGRIANSEQRYRFYR